MYTLSAEQKLANYAELIAAKKKKVENLQKEIQALEAKAAKLSNPSTGKISSLLQSAEG